MLCLRLGGKAGGVGRHEGERAIGIAAVFREVEMHPSDKVPAAVTAAEKLPEAMRPIADHPWPVPAVLGVLWVGGIAVLVVIVLLIVWRVRRSRAERLDEVAYDAEQGNA